MAARLSNITYASLVACAAACVRGGVLCKDIIYLCIPVYAHMSTVCKFCLTRPPFNIKISARNNCACRHALTR